MYEVTTDEQTAAQLAALPAAALPAFAETRTALELAPWTAGRSYHSEMPDGPVRVVTFGPDGCGSITYLVLEDQRRVDLLMILWVG